MITTFPKTLLATSIALSIAAQVQANDDVAEVNSKDVHTIVVTGEATGGLDTLITQEDLDQAQASTLNDIFRHEPEVSAGGSVSLGQKIYVRNVGEGNVNISVDGAEQASGVFHHTGRTAIEPELLKQVEVEAGAGSATAGSGALGGSVRFTTKDAADMLDEEANIGGLFKSTYSSNGEGFKNSATIYGRTDNDVFSGILSVVDSSVGTVVDGDGDDIEGTESEKFNGFAKVVLQPNEEHKLSLSYENLAEDAYTLLRPEWTTFARNYYVDYESTRETTNVNYTFDSDSTDLVELSVNAYLTNHELYRDFDGYTGGVESVGVTVQNISFVGDNELIYGFNYREDESAGSDETVSYEESGSVWGVYLQDIYYATDALTVTSGVRFDQYQLDDWTGEDFDHSGVSPNLSANYDISSALSVSAGYASAFRGAEILDSYNLGSDSNASDIDKEVSHNLEFGVNYKQGDLSIASGVYYTLIEDLIIENYSDGKLYNIDDNVDSVGFYVDGELQMGRLTVGANMHLNSTTVDGEYLTRYVYGSSAISTGHSFGINLDYDMNDKVQFGWASLFVTGIDDIEQIAWGETIYADKPGYMVHDLYANWKPFSTYDLDLALRVNNLFNEQYLDHTSTEDFEDNAGYTGIIGSYEAGRDIRLTASLKL